MQMWLASRNEPWKFIAFPSNQKKIISQRRMTQFQESRDILLRADVYQKNGVILIASFAFNHLNKTRTKYD